MWAYGSRLFISGLIDTVFARLDIFLIGRMYTTATLGYYTRAQSLDRVVRETSSESLVAVLFPYLSREQDNIDNTRRLYIRYLHIISFISFFLCGLLYVTATPLFRILFTARWDEAAGLFKILTIAGFAYPVSSLMVNILSARGNSKAFLRLELFKRALFIPVYVLGFFIGLNGFVYSITGAVILSVLLNTLFVEKEIQLSVLRQLKIMAVYGLSAGVITFLTIIITGITVIDGQWLKFIFHGAVFAILFMLIHFSFKTYGYQFVIEKVKQIAINGQRN